MFWLIAGAVAVVLFALAWWTSGRSRTPLGKRQAAVELDRGKAANQSFLNGSGGGGAVGGSGGF